MAVRRVPPPVLCSTANTCCTCTHQHRLKSFVKPRSNPIPVHTINHARRHMHTPVRPHFLQCSQQIACGILRYMQTCVPPNNAQKASCRWGSLGTTSAERMNWDSVDNSICMEDLPGLRCRRQIGRMRRGAARPKRSAPGQAGRRSSHPLTRHAAWPALQPA